MMPLKLNKVCQFLLDLLAQSRRICELSKEFLNRLKAHRSPALILNSRKFGKIEADAVTEGLESYEAALTRRFLEHLRQTG